MAPTGIRFRPPAVAISPEIRWLLLRALGPLDHEAPPTVAPEIALGLARTFELSSRIAARQGEKRLTSEIGAACAEQFARDRRDCAFATLQRLSATRDLAAIADGLGIPLVFLKFAGLHLGGFLAEGSREAADVDVLVAADAVDSFYSELRRHGYMPRDQPSYEHHPPTLDHPTFGPVEVHRFVPGVWADDGTLATVGSLAADGCLKPIPELPGDCSLPTDETQVAHLLVHGIAQHGAHPDAYAATRMLCDLIDLGLATEEGSSLLDPVRARVARSVSHEEVVAVRDLCQILDRGGLPLDGERLDDSDRGLVLRHILAGVLDPDYRKALNLTFFTSGLDDVKPRAAITAIVKSSLLPTRGQIEKIYGTPSSQAGYLGRRILHPFAVLGRFVQSGISLFKLRLRGRN